MKELDCKLKIEYLLDDLDLAEQRNETYHGAYKKLLEVKRNYYDELEVISFEAAVANLITGLARWGKKLPAHRQPFRYLNLQEYAQTCLS